MPYTYPRATWDIPNALLNYSGGFWRDIYSGQKELRAYVAGAALLRRQREQDWDEMLASMSRHTVKNTHREWLYPIVIRKSEIDTYDAQVLHYGDGELFAHPTQNRFGEAYGNRLYRFPLPVRVRQAIAVMSNIHNPAWTASPGVDFTIDPDQSTIIFRENPFTNADLLPVSIIDNTEIVDYSITLWLYGADIEDTTAYTHFGGVLGLPESQHPRYVDFLNAYADSVYCGPAHGQVCRVLSAVSDMPLVKEESETVELITTDNSGLHVVTDKHAYNFPSDNSPVVAVGDLVRAGDSLTDAIELIDLRNGTVPDSLRCLTVGADLFAPAYATGLMFDNQSVPVTVDTAHPSGKTFVSWPLGGRADVVEEFWDTVHANGVASGQTLAEAMDVRTNPPTQPTAASLPTTINPLHFLVKNILRFHTFVVIIRPSLLPSTGLGFAWLRHLRKMLPPHVMVLTLFELRAADSVILGHEPELLPYTYDPLALDESDELPVEDTLQAAEYINVTCL